MLIRSYNIHRETIHNFIWRSVQVFGKQGIVFLIFIICAKLLSPYEFGIYNYVVTIIFFLIMFGDFGISTATSKYVAEYNITDKDKLRSVLFNSSIIIITLTIIITIFVLLFGKYYLKENYSYALLLTPLLFLAPMTSLYDGIYRGLKKFKELAILSIFSGIISLTFIYFFIAKYHLVGALIAQDLFYFILFIVLLICYKDYNLKINTDVVKEIGTYSFTFGIAVFGYFLFSRISVLTLGYFNHMTEIATYELINKIFLIFLVPFTIIGQVVAPNFTELYAKKDFKSIFNKYKKYLVIFFLISICLSLIISLILPLIIKIYFKDYYNNLFFLILWPCVFIYATQFFNAPLNSGIIVSTGYAKLMTYLNIWIGISSFALSLLLHYLLGFIGIIYAVAIANIVGTAILLFQYYSKIKGCVNHNEK